MAYFNPTSTARNTTAFAFDIDEQGKSSISRQNDFQHDDTSMINIGKHCSLHECGQTDYLPTQCDCCQQYFCRTHQAPSSHRCTESLYELTSNPQCDICHEYLRLDWDNIHTKTQLRELITQHQKSGCQTFLLKQSAAQRAAILDSLRCVAPQCHNHTQLGNKLSTLRCKLCHEQVCLTHRFPLDHQCHVYIKRQQEEERREKEQIAKTKAKSESLLTTVTNYLTGGKNDSISGQKQEQQNDIKVSRLGEPSASEKLKVIQANAHRRAIAQCKNPYLLKKQQQQNDCEQSEHDKKSITTQQENKTQEEKQQHKVQSQQHEEYYPYDISSPLTQGKHLVHTPAIYWNTQASQLLIKRKAILPEQKHLPDDSNDRIFVFIHLPYSPDLQLSTSQTKLQPYTVSSLPLSTQPAVQAFRQASLDDETRSTLQPLTQLPTGITEKQFQQAPIAVCLNANWTISGCLKWLAQILKLPSVTSLPGSIQYTLSTLSDPSLPFSSKLKLKDVVEVLQHDFGVELQQLTQNDNGLHSNSNIHLTKQQITARKTACVQPFHFALGLHSNQ